ncbi:MAG TPA: hypothetical protein VJG48_01670 [Candidatus Paceibacterota bacterium]
MKAVVKCLLEWLDSKMVRFGDTIMPAWEGSQLVLIVMDPQGCTRQKFNTSIPYGSLALREHPETVGMLAELIADAACGGSAELKRADATHSEAYVIINPRENVLAV